MAKANSLLRLLLLLPSCPVGMDAADHGDRLLGLLKPTLLTLPNLETQDFQCPVLEMAKLAFVGHLVLGWKGVLSGLMELAGPDTTR